MKPIENAKTQAHDILIQELSQEQRMQELSADLLHLVSGGLVEDTKG